jgi:uncharacterized protein YjbI with pentapeptide repeats
MADQKLLDIIRQGKNTWNAWRSGNPESAPDFREANLAGLDLTEFDLHDADLRNASLRRACLKQANQKSLWQPSRTRPTHLLVDAN